MEHLFDDGGMPTRPTSGYDNEEIPDSMPLQNQGAIPVLVRLVDGELGEHFRPAEARRWTETHVMVGLYRTDPDTGRRKDQLAWLRAEDVYRVLRPEDVKRRLTRTLRRPAPYDGPHPATARTLRQCGPSDARDQSS